MNKVTYDINPMTEKYMKMMPKVKMIGPSFVTKSKGNVRCPQCGEAFNNSIEEDVAYHTRYHRRVYEEQKLTGIFPSVDEAKKAYETAERIIWESDEEFILMDAADIMIKAKWSLYLLLNIQGKSTANLLSMDEYCFEFVEVNHDYFPEEIYFKLLEKYKPVKKSLRKASRPEVKAVYLTDLLPGKELSYAELKAAERKYEREKEEND